MALRITEYAEAATDRRGRLVPVAIEPAVAEQSVAVSGTSASSAAFSATTRWVRLLADEDVHVKFGLPTPTATTSHQLLRAGVEYWRGVPPVSGLMVAARTTA